MKPDPFAPLRCYDVATLRRLHADASFQAKVYREPETIELRDAIALELQRRENPDAAPTES